MLSDLCNPGSYEFLTISKVSIYGGEVIFVPETMRTLEAGWPQLGVHAPSLVHSTPPQPGGSKAI